MCLILWVKSSKSSGQCLHRIGNLPSCTLKNKGSFANHFFEKLRNFFFTKPVDVLFVLVPSLEGDSRAEWTLVVVVVAHPAVVLVQSRLGVVLVAAAHAHVLLLAFVLHVFQECRLLPVDYEKKIEENRGLRPALVQFD